MNICEAPDLSLVKDGRYADSSQPIQSNLNWSSTLSLSQLRQQLEYLETQHSLTGDSHAYFLSCYIVSMKRCEYLIEAIRNSDHPEHALCADLDDRLIESIASYFSYYYFSAYEAVLSSGKKRVPNPWALALNSDSVAKQSPLHGMLLGLIAHSCYDLPLVLSETTSSGSPLYDWSNADHKRTYLEISKLLVEELPVIGRNIESTFGSMRRRGLVKGGVSIRLVSYLLRSGFFSRIVFKVLTNVHREALLNCHRLQRGVLSVDALADLCCKRMSLFTQGSIHVNVVKAVFQVLVKS
ncbi:MAG: DUF5995 family protein [Candidatus Thiodiazotropha lotti]|uniref:DUF5995 family protein n=1 Tax=Candidatus Thiodiazotropha lotti TaxID=2792787 RepID=A0A9E4K6Z6_9GAMM|nr:DUF5995 family protein [Candidatus Thiodiazotropha lotti]ODC01058.1 hypothetical protein A3197_00800 [Candidatus Thiodiazotropha endoloripes]MCG7920802.1 DUF5995 family protein [Candidatus Thiodiazotropha lotti]MCG7940896.1 DUF5995 family protein [Candidatus Thiodiazotropha lotti]MCG7989218.1 DUF5995 family protein [Candidatus Thiodiazotropha lotti]